MSSVVGFVTLTCNGSTFCKLAPYDFWFKDAGFIEICWFEVKTIEETWGWDKITNCWSKDMRSAIFLGAEYRPMSYTCQPRLLGQKARTYLMGDSIFKGTALGFGGKLFNEYVESNIVFGVKDNH